METIDEELEGTATYTRFGDSERDFQFNASAEKKGNKKAQGVTFNESLPKFTPDSLKSPLFNNEDDNQILSHKVLPSSMKKGVSMVGAKPTAPIPKKVQRSLFYS